MPGAFKTGPTVLVNENHCQLIKIKEPPGSAKPRFRPARAQPNRIPVLFFAKRIFLFVRAIHSRKRPVSGLPGKIFPANLADQ